MARCRASSTCASASRTCAARLPDAIVANGAGNFSVWVHRFWRYHAYPSQLAPTSGAMGYGVPAAVAAKLVAPGRPVVCFAGDGDFLMSGQELATAVQYDLPILVLVVNNGMYGTIRMHQERRFPGRVSGTDLVNPDFAALARAPSEPMATPCCGRRTSAGPGTGALLAGGPALLELRVDPEAITPSATLSEIRARAAVLRRHAQAAAPSRRQGSPMPWSLPCCRFDPGQLEIDLGPEAGEAAFHPDSPPPCVAVDDEDANDPPALSSQKSAGKAWST